MSFFSDCHSNVIEYRIIVLFIINLNKKEHDFRKA